MCLFEKISRPCPPCPRFRPNLRVGSRTGQRAFFGGHPEHIHTFTTRRLVVCLTRTERKEKDRETVSVQAPPDTLCGQARVEGAVLRTHVPGRSFPRNGNTSLLLCRQKHGNASHVCVCVCSALICEKYVFLPACLQVFPWLAPTRGAAQLSLLGITATTPSPPPPAPAPHSAPPHLSVVSLA